MKCPPPMTIVMTPEQTNRYLSSIKAADPIYDWTRAKRSESQKQEEPVERERHCQAADPKRCDSPDCPCGWP